MCFLNEAGFSAATLLIISELIRIKEDLKLTFYSFGSFLTKKSAAADDSDEEEHFVDVDKA